jgi:hypothetical protein
MRPRWILSEELARESVGSFAIAVREQRPDAKDGRLGAERADGKCTVVAIELGERIARVGAIQRPASHVEKAELMREGPLGRLRGAATRRADPGRLRAARW